MDGEAARSGRSEGGEVVGMVLGRGTRREGKNRAKKTREIGGRVKRG